MVDWDAKILTFCESTKLFTKNFPDSIDIRSNCHLATLLDGSEDVGNWEIGGGREGETAGQTFSQRPSTISAAPAADISSGR